MYRYFKASTRRGTLHSSLCQFRYWILSCHTFRHDLKKLKQTIYHQMINWWFLNRVEAPNKSYQMYNFDTIVLILMVIINHIRCSFINFVTLDNANKLFHISFHKSLKSLLFYDSFFYSVPQYKNKHKIFEYFWQAGSISRDHLVKFFIRAFSTIIFFFFHFKTFRS